MHSNKPFMNVGIDVSKAMLDACAEGQHGERSGEFENTPEGFRRLVKWIGKNGRVCVEATGVYHLALCIALRRAGVAVMVINPRIARDYARALSVRTKTDPVDAWTLLDFLKRMEFVAWEVPAPEILELRAIARRLEDLVQSASDEKKRQHAFITADSSRFVQNDVAVNLAHLKRRIGVTEKAAIALIRRSSELAGKFDALLAIPGIGRRSAVLLLAELLLLDSSMTVRQIVAYAGLDPKEGESGTSVRKAPRISRIGNARLRAILFLPAMALIRQDAFARHFRDRLVTRGKKKMQAIVAVMRKLLHAIWTIMRTRETFEGARLFPLDAQLLGSTGHRASVAESSDSAIAAPEPKSKTSHPKGRSEAEERQLDSSQTKARSGGGKSRAAA